MTIVINVLIVILIVIFKVVLTFLLTFGFIEFLDRRSTKRLLKGQTKTKRK